MIFVRAASDEASEVHGFEHLAGPAMGDLVDHRQPRPRPLFERSKARLTIVGLFLTAAVLPIVARMWSFPSAVALMLVQTAAVSVVITPSLAYMADAVSSLGLGSFGVAYGLYNMAWGIGLLGGPALGGWLFDRVGFAALATGWAIVTIVSTIASMRSPKRPSSRTLDARSVSERERRHEKSSRLERGRGHDADRRADARPPLHPDCS